VQGRFVERCYVAGHFGIAPKGHHHKRTIERLQHLNNNWISRSSLQNSTNGQRWASAILVRPSAIPQYCGQSKRLRNCGLKKVAELRLRTFKIWLPQIDGLLEEKQVGWVDGREPLLLCPQQRIPLSGHLSQATFATSGRGLDLWCGRDVVHVHHHLGLCRSSEGDIGHSPLVWLQLYVKAWCSKGWGCLLQPTPVILTP
jgi:hypothetical protein